MDPEAAQVPTDRVLTAPNVISLLRLLGVPLFFWLALVPHADALAVAVLVLAGLSDWLDGVLARRLNQVSRLGQVLDPLADRLYIAATLVALALRGLIPWWLVGLIALREVVLAAALVLLRRRGFGPLPVHLVGKAATMCLLYAFPLLLLGDGTGTPQVVARVVGWAFAIWGVGLYWVAAFMYLRQTRQLLRSRPATAGAAA